MQNCAKGFENRAATHDAQPLSPGTTIGMAMGAEMAPAHSAPGGTVRIGAAMACGGDLAAAPPWGHYTRGRGCGCLWARGTAGLTGIAMRLGGEARKGGGLTAALGPWAWGLRWCRTPGGEVAGPRPREHEAQPYECDQRELVEKQMRDHGKPPSDTCCNESILPGLSGGGMSRRLRVHDRLSGF
jgi:hypothetical protein